MIQCQNDYLSEDGGGWMVKTRWWQTKTEGAEITNLRKTD